MKRQRKRINTALLIIGWLLAVASGSTAIYFARRASASTRLVRAEILAPVEYGVGGVFRGAVALSPDGTRLAFIGENPGAPLLVRDLASGKVTTLTGTESAMFPFWSPDGRFLAFFSQGKLRKIEASGGPVQNLADAPEGRGGSWSPNGTIIFTPNIGEVLYRISDGGGAPVAITSEPDKSRSVSNRMPYFLPDGEHFLYLRRSTEAAGKVYVASLSGGTPKLVLETGSNVQYSHSYLLYLKDANLVAQQFDLSQLSVKGSPIAVAEKVDYFNQRDIGNLSASSNGVLAYRSAESTSNQFVWLDANGKELGTLGEPAMYVGFRFSPDGRKIAAIKLDPSTSLGDLWIIDVERKAASRLTFNPASQLGAAFSPDGKRIAITFTTGWKGWLVERSLSGTGGEEKLLDLATIGDAFDYSPDGRFLIVGHQEDATSDDISYLPLQGERKLIPFLHGSYGEQAGRLSPNGKWLAYVSNESGATEVYVTAFPGPGGKWQISNGGGNFPFWRRDGKELFYRFQGKVMAVEIRDSSNFEIGSSRQLFALTALPLDMDISPDGKKFLALKPLGQQTGQPTRLVLNWTEALKH